jgi:allantoinase
MSLPEDYIAYPRRAYGMDQDRYAWRPSPTRPKTAWPDGRSVACAIVVPVERFTLTPSTKPFAHPSAAVGVYPDMRQYSARSYGLRVGIFRILGALKAAKLTATVPINAALLGPLRPLVEIIAAEGHEIAAYGVDTDHIHWGGLEAATEARWVEETRAAFDAIGLTPRVWMSPARQQSFSTLDLIAEAGFDVCLDWEQDSVPVEMHTRRGSVTAVPVTMELDDRLLMIDRRHDEQSWSSQVLEAADYLKAQAPLEGGQVLGLTLTPFVAGQPSRAWAMRRILDQLAADPAVWSAGASEIADAAKS